MDAGRRKTLLSINVLFVALILLVLLIGRLWTIFQLPADMIQKAVLAAGALLLCAAATGLAACLHALSRTVGLRWFEAIVSILLLLGATYFICDAFSYRWIGMHLPNTLPMAFWNVRSGFVGLRSKIMGAILAFSIVLLLIVMAVLITACMEKRSRFASRMVRAGLPIKWLLCSGLVLAGWGLWNPGSVFVEVRKPSMMGNSADEDMVFMDSPQLRQVAPAHEIESVITEISSAQLKTKPNIFLFILDSLRPDAITSETAPVLSRFRTNCIPISRTLANANCTHISWISLLHGISPLTWSVISHQETQKGAVPLRLLKNAGYSIHVMSTPHLNYFNFARATFGSDLSLLDSVFQAPDEVSKKAGRNDGDLDAAVMNRLLELMASHAAQARSSFYLCILNSTHHEYQWPATFEPPFRPFMERVPLMPGAITTANLPLLLNRYRNSIAFSDLLFGKFLEQLEKLGLAQNSVIVFTGDHGEEFLEEGNLTHSSKLNRYQLEVPLFFYAPGTRSMAPLPVGSHMDVMPSILDVLGLGEAAHRILDGRSFFRADQARFAIAAQCSSYTPGELLLDDGDHQFLVGLSSPQKVGYYVQATGLVARRSVSGSSKEKSESLQPVRRAVAHIVRNATP